MIWADRVALVWGIFLVSALFLAFGEAATGQIHWGNLFVRLIIVPWAFLRVVDAIFCRPLSR